MCYVPGCKQIAIYNLYLQKKWKPVITMTPEVFAGAAVQHRLLSAFRIDDPLLDVASSRRWSFFLSACATHGRALWKRLRTFYGVRNIYRNKK